MSYTVKLAFFPPWKAPAPYETLAGAFATTADAIEAGEKALAPVTERELAGFAADLKPQRAREEGITAIAVPERAIHGFLIYDEAGIEVFAWTTLDVAVERAAEN